MIRRDYHAFRLHEALCDAEDVVGSIRSSRKTEDAEFIVGHGVIRNELVKLLEGYGLAPRVQLGNRGVILCTIE
jgi:hypothetical protein